MRDLYPSAHHDRFVHSIGTYHIGRMMGEQIKNNKFVFNDILNKADILNSDETLKIDAVIKNFEVACLLHDCGHAPFSHTFEHCFKQVKEYEKDIMEVAIKYIAKQICEVKSDSYPLAEIEKVLRNYIISNKSGFDQKIRAYLIIVKDAKKALAILKELQNKPNNEIDTFEDDIRNIEKDLNRNKNENRKLIESIYSDFEKVIEDELPKFNRNDKIKKLFTLLLEYFIDSSFESPKPHEIISSWLVLHEKGFGEILQEMHLDPLLIARMICGYKYNEFDKATYCDDNESSKDNKRVKEILNCFISLLNGKVIDADKLDYCLRDKWASGVNVNNIEINKLLESLSIRIVKKSGQVVVCFSKGAIPEIESVIDSKNKVSYWCHNHNKIVYRQELLKNAVEKLAVVFAPKNQREEYQYLKQCRHEFIANIHDKYKMNVYNESWSFVGIESEDSCYSLYDNYSRSENANKYPEIYDFIKIRRGIIEQENIGKIFNYHSFISPQTVTVNIGQLTFKERLLLISDDDIMCLLKKFLLPFNESEAYEGESELEKEFRRDASKYVKDLFSRNQDLIPLWKSRAEFHSDFKELLLPTKEGEKEEDIALREKKIEEKIGKVVSDVKNDRYKELNDKSMPCRVICRQMTPACISEGDVYIDAGGNNVRCYTTLDLLSKGESTTINFEYVFVPKVKKRKDSVFTWNKSRDIYLENLKDIK